MVRFVRPLAVMAAGFLPALGLWLGAPWPTVLVSALALVLAIGWPAVADVPAPHTARAVLVLTAAVSIVAASVWHTTADAAPVAVLLALAVGFPAAFVRELARPAPRGGLVRSVSGTVTGVGLSSLWGLWLPLATPEGTLPLALAAGCGIAGAAVTLVGVGFLPAFGLRSEVGAAAAVVIGAGCGVLGAILAGAPWWAGAALGGIAAILPAAQDLIASAKPARIALRLGDLAVVAVPVAVAALPVWVAAIIL
jgi:hypothetical protein